MARNLTNDEILAAIEREEKSAYGYYNGTLSEERQKALDYYLGDGFSDDEFIPEGRSRVVSTDVADTIEWVLPQLLKIFLSGEEVVKFMPVGAEDVAAAEQETAFVNNTVTQKNDAFSVFYSWFKTALIQKMGYVKAWYEEKEDVTTERYEGLTDEEFQMLLSDDDLEPTEHEEEIEEVEVMGPQGPMMQQHRTHSVTIRKKEKTGEVKICAVPPEELFVSTTHREVSLKDAHFVEHRTKRTISYIRELGYSVPDNIADDSDTDTEEENRDQYEEFRNEEGTSTGPMRQVWLRDIYMRIDVNGDGIAEMKRFIVVGKKILDAQDWDVIPFASLCPVPMPNRHVGLSYADLIMDLQEIKSMLLRQTLDNGYLSINGRYAISDRVNLDDMMVSRPGGVVRVEGEPGAHIFPLTHPQTSMIGVQLLEYADTIKEGRTGITKYTQGMDSNSLNKTATGITQIMQMAQARIELIARLFAEIGVKDLFSLVHGLLLKHEKAERVLEINKQWVPVNPREWRTRNDMIITVGIGTGNKDQQLMHLGNMFQMAMTVAPMGVVTPANMHNLLSELAKNAGFKDTARFFTDPSQQPPQEPQPPPEVMVEQMRQQGKMQEMQVKAQLEQQQQQASLQQEQLRSQNDVAIERDKLNMQAELEKFKAQLQAQTELEKTRMQLEAEKEIEAFRARNDAVLEMQKQRQELSGVIEQARGAKGDESMNTVMQGLQAMIQQMGAPKEIVRDETGRAVGIQQA